MHFMTGKPSLGKENCPCMTSRVQHTCILWKENLHQVKNSPYMTPRIQYTCILQHPGSHVHAFYDKETLTR